VQAEVTVPGVNFTPIHTLIGITPWWIIWRTEISNGTWCELHSKPHAHWHYTMMNHMQSGDMVILLAQDKENLPHKTDK